MLCESFETEEEMSMSDEWENLKNEVLEILKRGAEDIADDTRDELKDFLKDKAKMIAKEKWRMIKADTDAERAEAEENLKHLYAQVQGEITRLNLATTQRAKDLLGKVLEVGIDAVRRLGPKIFGG
jgi:hypothetical protein